MPMIDEITTFFDLFLGFPTLNPQYFLISIKLTWLFIQDIVHFVTFC